MKNDEKNIKVFVGTRPQTKNEGLFFEQQKKIFFFAQLSH